MSNPRKNKIGSVTVIGTASNTTYNFTGISKTISTGTVTISNNIIGSTTDANSINAISPTTFSQNVTGIFCGGTGINIISANTIANLSNSNANASSPVYGINYRGGTTLGTVSGNFIHSLSVASLNATIYGIYIADGSATYSNNIISLGSGITNGNSLIGIKMVDGNTGINKMYYNTVDIEGSVVGTTANTYALSNAPSGSRDYRNNIFNNSRSGGSTGKHYSISLTSIYNLTIDYNDYYAPNGVLGLFNGVDKTTLTDWATSTGGNTHSKNVSPGFASAGGTLAANYLPSELSLVAATGTGVTTDYAGIITRSGTLPSIGAWEYTLCNAPAISSQSTATQTQCINGTFAAINVTATGDNLSYQWYSNTMASTTLGTPIAVGTNSNSYTPLATTADTLYYYCVITGSCGVDTTLVSGAFITNAVTAISSQSTATQTQCVNGTFTPITVTATGANLSYQWYKKADQITSGGTTVGTNSNSYTPSASTVGTLYYYCVVTGTCGTTQTSAASGAFTVNPLPVAGNITGGSAVCMGNTLQLTSNATGTATLTYVWHSSNTGVATVSNTGLVTPVATGSTNITYTVTDGSTTACTATSATFGVTVNPLPVAGNITGFNSVCMGNTLQLTSNATGTPTLTYVWHSSNTSVATVSNTGLVTPVSAASANITYTVTDGSTTTCSATSANFGVSVNSLPVPAISGSASVCVNSTGNVYTTQTGKSNYTWNVSGGTITSGGTTSSNTATITWNTSGAESASVNYTTPFTFLAGCSSVSPTIYPVTVNPLPVPTITGNTIGCINSTGNAYSTEAGMTGYTWNVTGGTITSGSTTNTINVTWTSLGAQTISVNYTNTNSCTAATATVKNITVSQLPAPTLSGATNLCNHTTGNIYTTEAGMTSYNWSVTGGTITAGTGTNAITVTWNTEGAQSVSVNYANANGCTAASATVYGVTLKSAPYPVITGSPSDTYIVPKLATYQYSTPLVAGDLYSWSSPKIEGYCSATARNCVNVHFLDPCCVYGEWTISVTETNPSTGCSTIATKLIYITP